MPLVKKKISIAAGATSDQVLAGTTYEYVEVVKKLTYQVLLMLLLEVLGICFLAQEVFCQVLQVV